MTIYIETLPSRMIHIHVMSFVETNLRSTRWVVNDNVGI